MQTEKAKSSHFDRTRELKNQIFPTINVKLHVQSYFIRVHREIHTSTLAIASGIQMEKKFFRKQPKLYAH